MQTNLSVRFLDITNQKSSGVKKWDVPTWPDSDRMMRHYRSFLWSFISKELIWTCERINSRGDKGWDIEQFCFWSFCSGWDICLHWRDDFRCKISFKMSTKSKLIDIDQTLLIKRDVCLKYEKIPVYCLIFLNLQALLPNLLCKDQASENTSVFMLTILSTLLEGA